MTTKTTGKKNGYLVKEHADRVDRSDENPVRLGLGLQFRGSQQQKENTRHVDVGIGGKLPPGGRKSKQQRQPDTDVTVAHGTHQHGKQQIGRTDTQTNAKR
jgi:hypothetical protein